MSHILTIDDGPTLDAIEKIDYLNNQNIPSIWFCEGENLERNPDAAIHAIKTGHIVANHSFSHQHFSEISLDDAAREVERTEALIDNIYADTGVPRPARLFRFPFGDQGQNKDGEISTDADRIQKKSDLQSYLAYLAFNPLVIEMYEYREPFVAETTDIDWLWSYDIQEWAIHDQDPKYHLTFEQVAENLETYLQTYDRSKNQIVLTHDHTETTEIFPKLIDAFLRKNIDFVLPAFEA